jgi:hypothetical protein
MIERLPPDGIVEAGAGALVVADTGGGTAVVDLGGAAIEVDGGCAAVVDKGGAAAVVDGDGVAVVQETIIAIKAANRTIANSFCFTFSYSSLRILMIFGIFFRKTKTEGSIRSSLDS